MAACLLDVRTPQGANGMTVCLSEKTRVIAHAGLKYKSGYITISKYSPDSGKWRNVHIARKSMEKLMPLSGQLLEALKKREGCQLQLTKKQFLMVSKFNKPGRDTMHFISILHPKTEQEKLSEAIEYNHAKTINLNQDEYEKLHSSLDKLYQVTKTCQSSGENGSGASEESDAITCYRWTLQKKGTRSNSVFLTREECDRNAKAYIEDLPAELKEGEHDTEYSIHTTEVPRPSKVEVIEHIMYNEILRKTGFSAFDLALQPPSVEVITQAVNDVSKSEIVQITSKVAAMIGHKKLYFLSEMYDVFVYVGGIDKVKEAVFKHHSSPSGKLFARLLDSCYNNAVKPETAHDSSLALEQVVPESQPSECPMLT